MHSWMAMSWVRKDLTLYFSRKSGSKGARIQTTVSQSQKMNYCWAESDWNWKSRCTKNQKGKRNKWERRKKVNHPNSKVGCWASDRHTIAFKKWVRVAITRMRPFLWWKQSQPPWGPFVSSMRRPSPPWWTFSAVPLVQAAIRGLHFLARFHAICAIRAVWSLSKSVYDSYCMTTYMLGWKTIQNQSGEVLMPQVCPLLGSEQN